MWLITVTCAENSSSVLVLVRASAIWGTRKRVTQILIMGYMGYVLMLIGGTTYGIHNKQGTRLACFLFIFAIHWNGCVPVVHFKYLNLVNICLGGMPSTWLPLYLFCILTVHPTKNMWSVGSYIFNQLTDISLPLLKRCIVDIWRCKVRVLCPVFIDDRACWRPSSFVLDTLVFILTLRSLRKYSREFQYLYPSGLLHILVRDGERWHAPTLLESATDGNRCSDDVFCCEYRTST